MGKIRPLLEIEPDVVKLESWQALAEREAYFRSIGETQLAKV